MSDDLYRECQLIQEIEGVLPEFAAMCKDTTVTVVLMHQDAFAPRFSNEEMLLLGKAIKYAGLLRKEVRIVPQQVKPA